MNKYNRERFKRCLETRRNKNLRKNDNEENNEMKETNRSCYK